MKSLFVFAALVIGITAQPAYANVTDLSNQALFETGHRFLLGLQLGSGGGYVERSDGLRSSAGFHVMPEIGYFLWPRVSLSAQVREDIAIAGDRAWQDQLTNGLALLGRGTLWLGDGPTNLKLSLFAGNGNYFHRFRGQCGAEGTPCTSVTTSGDKIVGAGIGVSHRLGTHFELTGGVDLAGGVPNGMVNADLNIGVTARF